MPTESKRSRSHRADDDGRSGGWKRNRDDQQERVVDESLSQSSTGEESCPICDGSGEDCDGNPCGACCATGTRPRPARIDPLPTIAPGTLRRNVDPGDPCDGMECVDCSDHACEFSPCYDGPKVEPPED